MSTKWVTQQILAIRRTAEPMRFNPRPAGVMRPGSTTEAVHRYLDERPGRGWVTRQSIVVATGRSPKAVDWALIFLRTINRIEASQDPEPHRSRYLRYRVVHMTKGRQP